MVARSAHDTTREIPAALDTPLKHKRVACATVNEFIHAFPQLPAVLQPHVDDNVHLELVEWYGQVEM